MKPIFIDNAEQRMLSSANFNFALDKSSGISACWGKDINDSPEYDPYSPEEISLVIDENFELEKYLKIFNFFANVHKKISDTEFEVIDDILSVLTETNLIALSTLGNVNIILNTFENIKINDILTFTNYIKNKFSIPVLIQLNMDKEISYDELNKLKMLGNSIQLKTSNKFNFNTFSKNINLLKDNQFSISTKIIVTDDTYREIFENVDKFDNEIPVKLYFIAPYISVKKYKNIQTKFLEASKNVYISTCAFDKFNSKKNNIYVNPCDCDATRFSLYIEDDKVYPCEFNKSVGINVFDPNSLFKLWNAPEINIIRKYIIKNNHCKTNK